MINKKQPCLVIEDLHVRVDNKEILKGLNLTLYPGEIHALMGPNGSGKSTLSNALMGHPQYQVTQGNVWFKGEDLIPFAPDERARKGIFLAFQYPIAIPGVKVFQFLRNMLKARNKDLPAKAFRKLIKEKIKLLNIKEEFLTRYLNEGFSGGEKKRHEILQMALCEPELAILDETDSGLDIDALKIVCEGIKAIANDGMGILIITHYQRMLSYIEPDFVHVLFEGQIVRSGDKELAKELEKSGYEDLEASLQCEAALSV